MPSISSQARCKLVVSPSRRANCNAVSWAALPLSLGPLSTGPILSRTRRACGSTTPGLGLLTPPLPALEWAEAPLRWIRSTATACGGGDGWSCRACGGELRWRFGAATSRRLVTKESSVALIEVIEARRCAPDDSTAGFCMIYARCRPWRGVGASLACCSKGIQR